MAARQTENDANDQTEGRQALKRRGLIAGAAALVAGIAAKQMAEPVAADTFSIPGEYTYPASVFVWKIDNTSTGDAIIGNASSRGVYGIATGTGGTGVGGAATSANGTGVQGLAAGDTSTNTTGFPIGVRGSIPNTGYGVYGNAGNGAGVYGTATGVGVQGDSSNVGVQGHGGGDTSGNTTGFPVGVRGSVPDTGFGVHGHAGNGTGVYGTVTGGFGVYGVSTTNYGVVGQSTSGIGMRADSTGDTGVYGTGKNYGVRGDAGSGAGASGLLGVATSSNAIAFGSVVVAPATIAGYFNGEVHVEGPFYVDPVSNKHGVITHADGTKRVLYSMEAPESWIEDFGTGTLANGKASIALDKDFAGIIHADDYHVFLTERDVHQHLIVTGQTPAGFTIEADAEVAALKGKKAADLGGTFSYRVVAKPNVGKVVERLPKYTKPTFKMPDPVPPLPTKKP